jgi:hypothetical protein
METTREPLDIGKLNLVQWKIVDPPTSCSGIIAFVWRSFKNGGGVKFWGYGGTNAEPLRTGFCSFVQCRILLNCWSPCLSLLTCPS